jgi:UDP-glucuronate 4-epimerase
MKILVTGAAGFIGSTLAHRLLDRGDQVVGIDNLNEYYDVRLKHARLDRLRARSGFVFQKLDIVERKAMAELFSASNFEVVVHLAAQAGVRYSIENPSAYVDANLVGFLHVLEGCRHSRVGHLVFASSSSVYGANTRLPFSEHDNVDHPVSLYAATKKANELMAHSYASLYGMPCTGLRFFTVYGPWGRPDMALFKFTEGILAGRPIPVFNRGDMVRDFTYVDDIVTSSRASSGPWTSRLHRRPAGTASGRTRRPAMPPGASSTSATTSRLSYCAISRCSSSALAGRRSSSCSPCSRGTCRRPSPTWAISSKPSATSREPR